MSLPYFPASELDDPQQLLAAAGGFWSSAYAGRDLVADTLYARGRLTNQSRLAFSDLLACLSVAKTPLYRVPTWQKLTLLESQLNQAATDGAHFDGAYVFDGGLLFDQQLPNTLFVWEVDAGLTDVLVITNRITESSLTLIAGVDFVLAEGCLWFRDNPFTSELVAIREVFGGTEVSDRECDLWLYRSQWDEQTLYRQFGYAVGDEPTPSSENYRAYLQALYTGASQGPAISTIESLFAIVCDVPLTRGDGEVVERVTADTRGKVIVTDQYVYRATTASTVLVSAGDVLTAGQPLTDALHFYEFNRGQVPAAITSLTMGSGFLATGYFGGLTFANTAVPLVIDAADASGYTRVEFSLGGYPGDTERFWDDVHAAGVANNQTLAMLLDQRPEDAKDTTPSALALPREINPLQFLIENVLRNNAFVVTLRSDGFGPNALGLAKLKALRRLLLPHTACLILIGMTFDTDTITMEAPGDDTTPGYSEDMNVFLGSTFLDTIDATELLEEELHCSLIGGQFV